MACLYHSAPRTTEAWILSFTHHIERVRMKRVSISTSPPMTGFVRAIKQPRTELLGAIRWKTAPLPPCATTLSSLHYSTRGKKDTHRSRGASYCMRNLGWQKECTGESARGTRRCSRAMKRVVKSILRIWIRTEVGCMNLSWLNQRDIRSLCGTSGIMRRMELGSTDLVLFGGGSRVLDVAEE
jgi:hypothetical protein